jgi:hypothetical protein
MTIAPSSLPNSSIGWLERPVLTTKVDGLRLSLAVYFLTFGLFGYGSELRFSEPLSFAPAFAGLVVGLSTLLVPKSRLMAWQFALKLQIKHLVLLAGIFAALAALSSNLVVGELVGDELAYVGITTAHASQLLGFLPLGIGGIQAAGAIQVGLIPFVLFSFLAFVLISRVNVKVSIACTVLSALAAQVGFALVGGWGWGYADVSWYPYMVSAMFFGVSPITFSLTSVAIVSIGLTVLFFGLKRNGLSIWSRLTITAVLMTLPVPFLYFSAVDHVVYFYSFALAITPFLLSRITDTEFGLSFLAAGVGVMFRLTLLLVVATLVVSAIRSGLGRTRESVAQFLVNPAFTLLIPYGVGIVLNPPVFSGRPDDGTILEGIKFEQIFTQALELAGTASLLVLVLGLCVTIAFRGHRLLVFWVLFTSSLAYFVALRGAQLAGEPKYSLEWLPWAIAVGCIAAFSSAGTLKSRKFRAVVSRALVFSLSLLLISNVFHIVTKVAPFGSSERSLEHLDSYRNVGYSRAISYLRAENTNCTPVGVVYGNSNEILGGLSWQQARQAQSSFTIVQMEQNARANSRGRVTPQDLLKAQVNCAYGQANAFAEFGTELWSGWDVVSQDGNEKEKVIVVRKVNVAD